MARSVQLRGVYYRVVNPEAADGSHSELVALLTPGDAGGCPHLEEKQDPNCSPKCSAPRGCVVGSVCPRRARKACSWAGLMTDHHWHAWELGEQVGLMEGGGCPTAVVGRAGLMVNLTAPLETWCLIPAQPLCNPGQVTSPPRAAVSPWQVDVGHCSMSKCP